MRICEASKIICTKDVQLWCQKMFVKLTHARDQLSTLNGPFVSYKEKSLITSAPGCLFYKTLRTCNFDKNDKFRS